MNLQDYIFFSLMFLIPALLLILLISRTGRSDSHSPPSPLSLPIIGHLHLISPLPHQAFHKLSNKYGSLFHINLGSVPCVVASSPETAKEFLKTHETYFSSRPQSFATDYITYGSQDFTFAPYGPYWKFMKKLCISQLLGSRTLDLLFPVRHDEIKKLIDSLFKKAKAGEEVDVGEELIRMSSNVISRMIMSKRCSEDNDEAGDVRMLIKEAAELTGKFNLSDFIWFCKNLDLQGFKKRLHNVSQRFDKMMEEIIEEHRKADDEGRAVKDLLDILLEISEDESSEIRLTRENIKAFILDVFVAGTDTSSLTIEWGLAELINHPNIMKKAVQEIDEIVGKERLVAESDIFSLPYIQAIVKETLRLHPPGPLLIRESSEDCIVKGYEIPAKTRVFINVWAIGRDPNYWEKPLEFIPERFVCEDLSGEKQMDLRGQHYQFLPFGSGRRGCPGTSLGLQVVQTTLAALIQCFEWKVKNGDGIVDMVEGPGLTLSRAHPLVCVPMARLNQSHHQSSSKTML